MNKETWRNYTMHLKKIKGSNEDDVGEISSIKITTDLLVDKSLGNLT